uniref:Protocadherin-1 n=1 Tax=Mesocestoides corti TaxID=53468 RepID=A0A5K3F137_MESCO
MMGEIKLSKLTFLRIPLFPPLLLLLLHLILHVRTSSSFLPPFASTFDVVEESPQGTTVAGVAEYLNRIVLLNVEMPNSTTFQLMGMDPLTKSFVINPKSGELRIAARVDREIICKAEEQSAARRKEPPGDSACLRPLNVLIKSQGAGGASESSRRQQLTLRIVDINDNAPRWPGKSALAVKFVEAFDSPPSYGKQEVISESRILERAFDPDAGSNGTVSYALKGSGAEMFRLENADSENGRFDLHTFHDASAPLRLRPVVPLDREVFAVYNLTLFAFDSGQPQLSGSIPLNVYVTDVNDHAPVFHTSSYGRDHKQGDLVKYVPPRGHLMETASVGSFVLQVNATDDDAGENARISYSIAPSDAAFVQAYFVLDPISGHLTVKQRLDYDHGPRRFNFKVIAVDGALEPYRLTGTAIVDIELTDVNDEKPSIEILIAQNDVHNHGVMPQVARQQELVAYIEETPSPDIVVAYVQVCDADENGEDHVSCHLGARDNFTLQAESLSQGPKSDHFGFDGGAISDHSNKKVSEYRILAKVPASAALVDQHNSNLQGYLDRETTPSQLLTVTCMDRAGNEAKRQIRVHLLDVNDNAPRFVNNSHFNFSVAENREPMGSQQIWLGRVHAVDPDVGENARVSYHLASDQHHDIRFSASHQQLFRVDADTGDVYAQVSLDRENAPDNGVYTMFVLAVDHGTSKQLTGTARVDVSVLDVNDWAPEFTRDIYTFVVSEDVELREVIGTVEAVDKDATAGPNTITYHLNIPRPGLVKRSLKNDTTARVKRDTLSHQQQQQQPLFMPHLEPSKMRDDRPLSYFSIDSRTGEIHVIRKLDREANGYFTFEVLAIDSPLAESSLTPPPPPSPQQPPSRRGARGETFTATATVVVTLTDVNDNAPEFRYPTTSILLHMALGETLGHKILTVQAMDRDDGENARISYSIRSEIPVPPDGPGTGNFAIDETSGLVFLTRPVQGPVNHRIVVEACDHGEVPKCTASPGIQIAVSEDAKLIGGGQQRDRNGVLPNSVSVSTLESGADHRFGYEALYGLNGGLYDQTAPHRVEVIAACLVVVFGVLLLAAVVLACLLKKKKPGSAGGMESGNAGYVCTTLWGCQWPFFKPHSGASKQTAQHYVSSQATGNIHRFSDAQSIESSLAKGMLSADSITNTLDAHADEEKKPLYYDGLGMLVPENLGPRGDGRAHMMTTSPAGVPFSRRIRHPISYTTATGVMPQTVVFSGNATMSGHPGQKVYGTLPVVSTIISDPHGANNTLLARSGFHAHHQTVVRPTKFVGGMPQPTTPPSPDYQSLDQLASQMRSGRNEVWQNQPAMELFTSPPPPPPPPSGKPSKQSSSYGCLADPVEAAGRRQRPTHNYYEINPLSAAEDKLPIRAGSQKRYQRSSTLGRLAVMDENGASPDADFMHHSSAGVLSTANNANSRSYSQLQATSCLDDGGDCDKPTRYTYQAIREASFV